SSRRRHTRFSRDWSSDVCSSDLGDFAAPVALDIARAAWMQALDEPQLAQRFRAGGVTFCTLLPLRAIPFEVVCLLGMNDGDYPRSEERRVGKECRSRWVSGQ